jgi:hypothetical protein
LTNSPQSRCSLQRLFSLAARIRQPRRGQIGMLRDRLAAGAVNGLGDVDKLYSREYKIPQIINKSMT